MRKTTLSVYFAILMITVSLSAASSTDEAAEALQHGKQAIAARNFDEAVAVLKKGLETAARIEDADTREQALSALHFYAAVAHSGAVDVKAARSHLDEFFRLAPHSRVLDSTKYDVRFVTLFNELAGSTSVSSAMSFYAVYPSIQISDTTTTPQQGTWGSSPALELLGSQAEKREWSELVAVEERQKFIDDFWKRRDPIPDTSENEFRQMFERRVAYADRIFGSLDARGSVSDRGRVFVLLGEPSSVRRRPLTRWDQVRVYLEPVIINGTVEHWVYGRDQLPMQMAKDKLGYRFITQKGIGDHVLQQEDVFAMKALKMAMNPNEHKKR